MTRALMLATVAIAAAYTVRLGFRIRQDPRMAPPKWQTPHEPWTPEGRRWAESMRTGGVLLIAMGSAIAVTAGVAAVAVAIAAAT